MPFNHYQVEMLMCVSGIRTWIERDPYPRSFEFVVLLKSNDFLTEYLGIISNNLFVGVWILLSVKTFSGTVDFIGRNWSKKLWFKLI